MPMPHNIPHKSSVGKDPISLAVLFWKEFWNLLLDPRLRPKRVVYKRALMIARGFAEVVRSLLLARASASRHDDLG